jgi:hypothetical protein|tara:strand:- start:1934 stop:2197 length:264 start_codon:yes stop_codon:yes gene_type:complete
MGTTRSGRNVKKPILFVPTENIVEDDYCTDDYDTEIDSIAVTDDSCSEESGDEDEDEDEDEECDENGNLIDFVVDDDEVTDSEEECE